MAGVNKPVAFGLVTVAGIMIYSGLHGVSVADVLSGTVKGSLDPKGGTGFDTATGGPPGPVGPGGLLSGGGGSGPTGGQGKAIGYPCQGTHLGLGNWQSDNAVDIAVPVNTPVLAPEDGRITKVKTASDGCGGGGRFAGNQVTMDGASGVSYFFTHLCHAIVAPGQAVKKGEVIGGSGEANGTAHLHFAVSPPANVCNYVGIPVAQANCKVCLL